jgi:DNA-directed RNA polymerase subunit beta'
LIDINDFDAIRIGLASPKQIREWSSGEVTKPETINYRTLKPEKDGLFCERIFGPTKDWECYCGKYKRVRYKGIICERCGVEVTRQKVRRERMGHIDLAAPVSHIWFFKGVPSRIGYLLDIAPKELEKVLYFAASIVTSIDFEARERDVPELEERVEQEKQRLEQDRIESLAALEERMQRRRQYFIDGATAGFDEDDDYWARSLTNWAEENGMPSLEEARELAGGLLATVAARVAGEDPKKIRELVRDAAIREDRKLSMKELDNVAAWAAAARDSLAGERETVATAKGAAKKAAQAALDARLRYLAGEDVQLEGADREWLDALTETNPAGASLDKVRQLGSGLLREVVEFEQGEEPRDLREVANDLCLRTDGRMSGDDVRAIQEWALKVRDTYNDMLARRRDVEDHARESVDRLERTWIKFKELEIQEIISDEALFRELKDRFGSPWGFGEYFTGGMGAEAIRELLRTRDLDEEAAQLRETIRTSKGQKQTRAAKRLKVVSAFTKSENKPEWMVLETIPVIPPELRPMVQLDGGRFATSDLNDLYRRVINRNNRLKRLLDLGAPEIIVNNEKRMLQEAVDALFDNGRRGRAVTGPGNRPLKSLSDMLKGKQGRFRQNLLGKRVDYSGRSVIVAGPSLKLHQCGLPKLMALELFKPFIMSRLVERKAVQNIKAAKKMVDMMVPEVWDVLEEVIAEHPVLLNRAPTLHRLGIQAFEPILVEGKAIQVHPLVCHAFNADFDGDQMAVHLPLSVEAQAEARILMLSSNNILSPAHGKPLATPTQDMVLGAYYLTYAADDLDGTSWSELRTRDGARYFGSFDEVQLAFDHREVSAQDVIGLRLPPELTGGEAQWIATTAGRALLNAEIIRALEKAVGDDFRFEHYQYQNRVLTKREMTDFISDLVDTYGATAISEVLDTIKDLGFTYATRAGVTISKNDIVTPPDKEEILAGYEEQVAKAQRNYDRGLITEEERHEQVVALWNKATDEVGEAMMKNLYRLNPVFMMANSGARGSFKQIRQLAGMRGLMANPKGEIIERPIKSNFMEGLSVLEYFISTHGARKGLADTALRTADSGYLTRRLVDVSQDVIIRESDCGTDDHLEVPVVLPDGTTNRSSLIGRVVAQDATVNGYDIRAGDELNGARVRDLIAAVGDDRSATVPVRSVLLCRARTGVCQRCYGWTLATGKMSEIGDAVGTIAAQSIGEPGTQLTMRTFHTGGVAGADITHGLPRVVELFEARKPKAAATLADIAGTVTVEAGDRGYVVRVTSTDEEGGTEEYTFPRRTRLCVADGEIVERGTPLNDGPLAPGELLELRGELETARYLVEQVQEVYKSQGVEIHDKHIELIVRQMLKKVRIKEVGDTDFLPEQLVDKPRLEDERVRLAAVGGESAECESVILGITKASLATESFLSAASFQETTKVLTDAAIEGKKDDLMGLKENVIIGKLIPASTGLSRYRRVQIAPSPDVPQLVPSGDGGDVAAYAEANGDGATATAVAAEDEPEIDLTPKPGAEEPFLPPAPVDEE